MKLQKHKWVPVIGAIVLVCAAALTVVLNIRTTSAETDKKTGRESGSQFYSESANVWWKATLSEYSEKLSLVSYQKAATDRKSRDRANAEKGILVNDTGICYIEPHPVYQPIEIVYGDDDEYIYEPPQKRPESGKVTADPGSFVFTTYGYGHGVGMSQNGANFYASYSGWDYASILAHYYPGTYIAHEEVDPEERISAGGVSGSVADIVAMVTYNEIGAYMAEEAIKAQAVAIYTYIMYNGGSAYDLCPKQSPPQNIIDAVNSVLGDAVYFNGSRALTMFCASSGGCTASCRDIFIQDIPYLVSVSSEYDSVYDPHYGTVEVVDGDEVRADLEDGLGITLSSDPSNWIKIETGDGGYAIRVIIDGQVTIKGNELRNLIGLKSPKIEVEYKS